MNTDDLIKEIEHYELELSKILNRFKRAHSGIHIDSRDDPQYRQYVQELTDLFNDALGVNVYSKQIVDEANRGVLNFTRSPSYKSVENILSKVRAARTRITRNPELVICSKPAKVTTSGAVQDRVIYDVWTIIHPKVNEIAKPRFMAGHYADAVEAALKEINNVVKTLHKSATGYELDGVPLMRKAFTPTRPTILLGDLTTETGRNIQQGYMELLAGSMSGIRNPKAHGNIIITPERALHHLILASLLFYKIDERLLNT
ncbi:MAG: TIGR02391 family protein [Candidatus Saccharibacteria bacterium]|nr:TIGR02391 family protein [Moraxellaceae bacterium]